MPFGWFKKDKKEDEPQFDPTEVTPADLKKGWFIDFEADTYEVKKEYQYDWGDEYFTKEVQLQCGDETLYLHIEEDDEVEYSISKPVNMLAIDEDLDTIIKDDEKPPKKIEYDGKKFFRTAEEAGYFIDPDKEGDQEFISWTYMDEENKYMITIEQWDEDEFEAHYGRIVEEFEFSNIIAGNVS